MDDNEDYLGVKSYKNINEEEYHPTNSLRISKILSSTAIMNNSTFNKLKTMPVVQLVQSLHQYSSLTIQRNIMQNLPAVTSLNYDLIELMRLYKKKQIAYQSISLLLDIAFGHDLTLLLAIQEDYLIYKAEQQQRLKELQDNFENFNDKADQNKDDKINSKCTYFKENGFDMSAKEHKINVLSRLKHHIKNQLDMFVRFVREKREMNSFVSRQQSRIQHLVILQVLGFIELIARFIRKGVSSLSSFDYLALPKFSLELPVNQSSRKRQGIVIPRDKVQELYQIEQTKQDAYQSLVDQSETGIASQSVPRMCAASQFLNMFNDDDESCKLPKVVLIAMNYKLSYSYELQQSNHLFVNTQASQRIIFGCLQTISILNSPLIKSPLGTGKGYLVKQLANSLGKQLFEYNIDQQFSYERMINVVAGALSGGFFICFRNMDQMSLSTISLIASLSFVIRSALVEGKTKVGFENGVEVDVRGQAALIGTFSIVSDDRSFDFRSLPSSVQEQFRVLTFIKQDPIMIIKTFCYLLNFDNPQDIAIKFTYFMTMMNEQFVTNFQSRFNSNNDTDQNLLKFMSFRSQLVVFERALEMIRERDNEEEESISPLDAVKASLNIFFRGLLTWEMFEVYQEVFSRFFNEKPSLIVVDLVENRKILEPLKEYFAMKDQELHDNFIETAGNLIYQIEQKRNVIISGKAGSGKRKLLEIGAFVYERLTEKPFGIHFLPLDSMEWSSLQKLLVMILYAVQINPTKIHEALRDSLLNREDLLSKNSDTKPVERRKIKTLSKLDWLVFDCSGASETSQQITNLENILSIISNKTVMSTDGQSVKFPPELQIVIETDDLSQLSPRYLSAFTLIQLESEVVPNKDEFDLWLKRMVQLQPKFEEYQPCLLQCYDCMFEDICTVLFALPASGCLQRISKKHFLYNLTTILESFLNEIRKREIALGLYEEFEVTKNEILISFDPLDLRRISGSKAELDKYQIVLAQTIQDQRKQMQGESIFVFAICLVLRNSIKKSSYQIMSEEIFKRIEVYRQNVAKESVFKTNLFSFNFDDIFQTNNQQHRSDQDEQEASVSVPSLFDYQFDLITLTWRSWDQLINVESIGEIQSQLKSNVLSVKELVRLNPQAIYLEEVKIRAILEGYPDLLGNQRINSNASSPTSKLSPSNRSFDNSAYSNFNNGSSTVRLEIESQKMTFFLLKLLLSYNKKILLTSPKNNGKSETMKKVREHFLNQSKTCLFWMTMSEHIRLRQFQKMIQARISIKHPSLKTPKNSHSQIKQDIILIDDLNMASSSNGSANPLGSIRSLLSNEGWYCDESLKFIGFETFGFLGSCNINIDIKKYSRPSFFCEIPESLAQKCFVIAQEALSDHEIMNIYTTKIKSLFRAQARENFLDSEEIMNGLAKLSFLSFLNSGNLEMLSKKYSSTLCFSHVISTVFMLHSLLDADNSTKIDTMEAIVFLFNNNCCDQFDSNILDASRCKFVLHNHHDEKNNQDHKKLDNDDEFLSEESCFEDNSNDDDEDEDADIKNIKNSSDFQPSPSSSVDQFDDNFPQGQKQPQQKIQTYQNLGTNENNQIPVNDPGSSSPGKIPFIQLQKSSSLYEFTGSNYKIRLFPAKNEDNEEPSNTPLHNSYSQKSSLDFLGSHFSEGPSPAETQQLDSLHSQWISQLKGDILDERHITDYFNLPNTLIRKFLIPSFSHYLPTATIAELIAQRREIYYFPAKFMEDSHLGNNGRTDISKKANPLRKLTSANYQAVEDKLVLLLSQYASANQLSAVAHMERDAFVKSVLKLQVNLGEQFQLGGASNLLVKHNLEEEAAVCVVEIAVRSCDFIVMQLSDASKIKELINNSLQTALLSLSAAQVYIIITQQTDSTALSKIFQSLSMLFNSSEFHLLVDRPLLDEIIISYLLKHRKTKQSRDQILASVHSIIKKKIHVICLHRQRIDESSGVSVLNLTSFLSCLTVLLPKPANSLKESSLILHRLKQVPFLTSEQVKTAGQAFDAYTAITRNSLLKGNCDYSPVTISSAITKTFVVFSALKEIFIEMKGSFRISDKNYREMNELLKTKQSFFEERIRRQEESLLELERKIIEQQAQLEDVTKQFKTSAAELQALEDTRDAVVNDVRHVKADDSSPEIQLCIKQQYQLICKKEEYFKQTKEKEVIDWWQLISFQHQQQPEMQLTQQDQKPQQPQVSQLNLLVCAFLVIMSDEEFVSDKYSRIFTNEEQRAVIQSQFNRLSSKQLKQSFIKSYDIFILNQNLPFDRQIEFEKRKCISQVFVSFIKTLQGTQQQQQPLLSTSKLQSQSLFQFSQQQLSSSLEQNPSFSLPSPPILSYAQSSLLGQSFIQSQQSPLSFLQPQIVTLPVFSQIILNFCLLQYHDEQRTTILKQSSSRLDQLSLQIQFQSEEQTLTKQRMTLLQLDIDGFLAEQVLQSNSLGKLKGSFSKIIEKFAEIQENVLESLVLKSLALSKDTIFSDQSFGAAIYLSFFCGTSEDLRFRGIEATTGLSPDVQYYLRRLAMWTIQGVNFELDLLKNKKLPLTNSLLQDIGWIEFILKQQAKLPYLVVKDYSGVIEEYLRQSEYDQNADHPTISSNKAASKKCLHFKYFAADFDLTVPPEETLNRIFNNNTKPKQSSQNSPRLPQQNVLAYSKQNSIDEPHNILVLVNPQERLLSYFKPLIHKQYEDILIQAISRKQNESKQEDDMNSPQSNKNNNNHLSSEQQIRKNVIAKRYKSNQDTSNKISRDSTKKQQNIKTTNISSQQKKTQEHPKIMILISHPEYFTQSIKDVLKKCILVDSSIVSEFAQRHLYKDMLVNFFEFPEKMSLIYRHEKKIEHHQRDVNSMCEEIKKGISSLSEDDCSGLQNIDLSKCHETLKSLVMKQSKDEFLTFQFFLEGGSLEKRFSIPGNIFKSDKETKKQSNTSDSSLNPSEQSKRILSCFISGLEQVQISRYKDYAYGVAGLEKFSKIYEDMAGFIFAAKETVQGLDGSNRRYGRFGSGWVGNVAKQACENLKRNNIGSQHDTHYNLERHFASFFLAGLTAAMSEEEQAMFEYLMGVRCLRAQNQVNDLQLSLLIEGGHSYHTSDLRTFSQEKNKAMFLRMELCFQLIKKQNSFLQIPDYSAYQLATTQQSVQYPLLKIKRQRQLLRQEQLEGENKLELAEKDVTKDNLNKQDDHKQLQIVDKTAIQNLDSQLALFKEKRRKTEGEESQSVQESEPKKGKIKRQYTELNLESIPEVEGKPLDYKRDTSINVISSDGLSDDYDQDIDNNNDHNRNQSTPSQKLMHSSSFQEIRTSQQYNYMRSSSYRDIDIIKKDPMTESMNKQIMNAMMSSSNSNYDKNFGMGYIENEDSSENLIPSKNSMEIHLNVLPEDEKSNTESSISENTIINNIQNNNKIDPRLNTGTLRLSVAISQAVKTQFESKNVDSPKKISEWLQPDDLDDDANPEMQSIKNKNHRRFSNILPLNGSQREIPIDRKSKLSVVVMQETSSQINETAQKLFSFVDSLASQNSFGENSPLNQKQTLENSPVNLLNSPQKLLSQSSSSQSQLRPSIWAQSQKVLQVRKENLKRIQLCMQLLNNHREMLLKMDIPLISLRHVESIEKQSYFFLLLRQMVVNQGTNRQDEILGVAGQSREIRYLRYSAEQFRVIEKMKQLYEEKKQRVNFFSIVEDSLQNAKVSSVNSQHALKRNNTSVIQKSKFKINQAIIKSKLKKKEQIRLIEAVKQPHEIQEANISKYLLELENNDQIQESNLNSNINNSNSLSNIDNNITSIVLNKPDKSQPIINNNTNGSPNVINSLTGIQSIPTIAEQNNNNNNDSSSKTSTLSVIPLGGPEQEIQEAFKFKLPWNVEQQLLMLRELFGACGKEPTPSPSSSTSNITPFLRSLDWILTNHSVIQKFLFTSHSEYSSSFRFYKIPPLITQLNLSPIDICLLIKAVKPQDLNLYLRDLFKQTLGLELGEFETESLETLCRGKQQTMPILVRASAEIEASIATAIELKMKKSTGATTTASFPGAKTLVRISVHSGNASSISNVLKNAYHNGGWVVLSGIDSLQSIESLAQVIHAVRNIFSSSPQSNNYSPGNDSQQHQYHHSHQQFRLFILTHQHSNVAQDSPLAYLFSLCYQINIRPASSIKHTLVKIFQQEVNEHILNLERVLIERENCPMEFVDKDLMGGSVFLVQPQFKRLVKGSTQQEIPVEFEQLSTKESELSTYVRQICLKNQNDFVNIHCFCLSQAYMNDRKCGQYLRLIQEGKTRNMFNTQLVLCMFGQRERRINNRYNDHHSRTTINDSKRKRKLIKNLQSNSDGGSNINSNNNKVVGISMLDLSKLNTQLFDFLDVHVTNPFKFIHDYYANVFSEKEEPSQQAAVDSTLKLFWQDFLCYPLDKRRVIEVAGQLYPLHWNGESFRQVMSKNNHSLTIKDGNTLKNPNLTSHTSTGGTFSPSKVNNSSLNQAHNVNGINAPPPLLLHTGSSFQPTSSTNHSTTKSHQSIEVEAIFLNILHLPNSDPAEFLGFAHNSHIEEELQKSQKMLENINDQFYQQKEQAKKDKLAIRAIAHLLERKHPSNEQSELFLENEVLHKYIDHANSIKETKKTLLLLEEIEILFSKLIPLSSLEIKGVEESEITEDDKNLKGNTNNNAATSGPSRFLNKLQQQQSQGLGGIKQYKHAPGLPSRKQSIRGTQFALSFLTSLYQEKKPLKSEPNLIGDDSPSEGNNQDNLQQQQSIKIISPIDNNSYNSGSQQMIHSSNSLVFRPLEQIQQKSNGNMLVNMNQRTQQGLSRVLNQSKQLTQLDEDQIEIKSIAEYAQQGIIEKQQKLSQQPAILGAPIVPGTITRSLKFDQPCLFERIRNYLPIKQRQSISAQRDVFKAFFQMHKHLRQKPRHSHSIEYSKESNDFLRQVLRDSDFIRIFLLNEVVTCNKLIKCVQRDIESMKDFLLRKELFSIESQAHFSQMVNDVINNRIPSKWDYYGLFSTQKSLLDFLRVFLSKFEHISEVVLERHNKLFPSISLYKLFDPFSLIFSLLFENSKKLNVPVHMLKIKLCKLKRPPVSQNYNTGLCIRGITLRYGALNPSNDYLEEESFYEFEQELSYAVIKVVQRSEIKYDNEAYIPIEFLDSVHADLENRFIEQQELFNNDESLFDKDYLPPEQHLENKKDVFRHEVFGNNNRDQPPSSSSKAQQQQHQHPEEKTREQKLREEIQIDDILEANTIYFVKLPVISQDTMSTYKIQKLKLYFFFKSKFPQSYWARRGTHICFHKDF